MGSAIQMLFAAIGGIFASTTFMQTEYPTYRTGVWCSVGTQGLLCALVCLMTFHFRRQNKKADRDGMAIQDDVDFRYTY
jgi:hypothetical protein